VLNKLLHSLLDIKIMNSVMSCTIHFIFVSGKLSSISSLTERYSSHSLRLWKKLCAVFSIFALLPTSNIQ